MGSDVDAVTKSGRLFHTRAAATGNARSQTVDSRDGGSRYRYCGNLFLSRRWMVRYTTGTYMTNELGKVRGLIC